VVLIDTLPADLRAMVGNTALEENRIGCSGVRTFRVDGLGYLKIASPPLDLRPEHDRLAWLNGRLPVPRVRYFGADDSRQFMLISEIPGLSSHDQHFESRPRWIVTLLAESLKMIHAVDITGCPFDQQTDALLATAYDRLITNQVDESQFDAARQGRRASDLYVELLATRPTDAAPVFVHGDYCLPNVLVDPHSWTLTGFIDWGSAGVSDRYFDLALAARSITYNLGAEWVAPFFAACGLTEIDRARIIFFQTLDEFF
jgi:aminoglycoside phosphotransferase